MDYGHQPYLDALSSQKFLIERTLEQLERRTAYVLFSKHPWFRWVRQAQNTEEARRENEKKKIKQEAAILKHHQNEAKLHLEEARAKGRAMRQNSDLEEAYNARLAEMTEQEKEMEWDPIEDVVEQDRGTCVDVFKHFLFVREMADPTSSSSPSQPSQLDSKCLATPKPSKAAQGIGVIEDKQTSHLRKKAKPKPKSSTTPTARNGHASTGPSTGQTDQRSREPISISSFESSEQIRQRLRKGSKVQRASGLHVAGTIDYPVELVDKTASMPDDRIDSLLKEIA